MNLVQSMYHLVRADVLERCRRYSFLVTMAGALYIGYSVYAGYIQMHYAGYRGMYNCAWLGSLSALSISLFVSLVGFYVIKNSIERDRITGVGEILATTPISKFVYVLAKVISNFVVLMAIVLVQAISILIMMYLKREDASLDLWALYAPFLFLAIPAMAFTAAIAVLFESIRFLRGGAGNVVFFFFWIAVLTIPMINGIRPLDLSGAIFVEDGIRSTVLKFDSEVKDGFSYNAGPREDLANLKTFTWDGINWTSEIILARLSWFLYSLFIAMLASVFFDRFDTAKFQRSVPVSGEMAGKKRPFEGLNAFIDRATSFEWLNVHSRFARMLAVELSLMLKGLSVWWYLPALGLFIASLSVPMDVLKEFIFPIIWGWPILVWSKMGTREERYSTRQIIFSTPRILARQLPAMLAAGVVVSLVTASGVLLRFIMDGNVVLVLSVIVGSLFIPSLALAFGVWSKSSKLFEAIYIALWYIGPMNHVAAMDYTFTSPASLSSGMPLLYLLICGVLLAAAVSGRRRQMVI